MVSSKFDLVVVGGGAAGFFTAINCKEMDAAITILILEQTKEVLNKVRISGGGRCNVTNSIWNIDDLVKNYPRGERELIGPFSKFSCADTMSWFENKGVPLKIEADGRVFPKSDSSQSIIDCLMSLVLKYEIKIMTNSKLKDLEVCEEGFKLKTDQHLFEAKYVAMTPGSSNQMWQLLSRLGHTVVHAVPSLFTFNVKDHRLMGLMGLAVPSTKVTITSSNMNSLGPMLITHWGLSGPGILKLSAWAARSLADLNYKFKIVVDWMPEVNEDMIRTNFRTMGSKSIYAHPLGGIPSRLWKSLLTIIPINESTKWAEANKEICDQIIDAIKNCKFEVTGKSTFKEEFVTAGGVELKEVNFKRFESKKIKHLFLAGEVINVDAITGGFNFQAAWTGGYLIAQAIADDFNTSNRNK